MEQLYFPSLILCNFGLKNGDKNIQVEQVEQSPAPLSWIRHIDGYVGGYIDRYIEDIIVHPTIPVGGIGIYRVGLGYIRWDRDKKSKKRINKQLRRWDGCIFSL